MASALASAPSSEGPVEAPVRTPIWNSRPAWCSAMARSAIASGIAFGAPAGVKPLKPTVWPCSIRAAASAAVRTGKEAIIKSPLGFAGQRAAAGTAPAIRGWRRRESPCPACTVVPQAAAVARPPRVPAEQFFQPERVSSFIHWSACRLRRRARKPFAFQLRADAPAPSPRFRRCPSLSVAEQVSTCGVQPSADAGNRCSAPRYSHARAARPSQVVAVGLVDRHAVDHLDDAALDALQLVARAGQHQQQKEIGHRADRRLRSAPRRPSRPGRCDSPPPRTAESSRACAAPRRPGDRAKAKAG